MTDEGARLHGGARRPAASRPAGSDPEPAEAGQMPCHSGLLTYVCRK